MAGNGKYGKNSWKIGLINIVLTMLILVVGVGIAGGAFFFIKPRFEAYQESKAREAAEEETRIAQEEQKAQAEAAQAEKEQAEQTQAENTAVQAEQAPVETAQAEAEGQTTATAKAAGTADYIIPDSNSRYLSSADVQNLSIKEVNYAKNELYARKGRRFQSKELREYFESKSWYKGTIDPDAFDDSYFNQYELANAEFLSKTEFSMNPSGYQLDQ